MKMLGDSAVQTPAVTTAHCKRQMPEKSAQTKARMANEDAKRHRRAKNSSYNCTLRASNALDQAKAEARMANEDARSHRSADTSSHNCTLQAANA